MEPTDEDLRDEDGELSPLDELALRFALLGQERTPAEPLEWPADRDAVTHPITTS